MNVMNLYVSVRHAARTERGDLRHHMQKSAFFHRDSVRFRLTSQGGEFGGAELAKNAKARLAAARVKFAFLKGLDPSGLFTAAVR